MSTSPETELKQSWLPMVVISMDQVQMSLNINAAARLRALKLSFLCLAALSLLVVVPSRRRPGYGPGEVPSLPKGSLPE